LIVMTPDGEPQTVELEGDSASIGRAPENTIQLDDVACSRRHCQVLKISSGFELTDMKSRNGTKVNGVQRNRHVLSDGDIIEIGQVRITYREQVGAEEEVVLEDFGKESEISTEGDCYLVVQAGEGKGKKIPLSSDRTTMGRNESNAIVVRDQMVSSYHCEITREAGGYVLRDLGSTNGCVVNGETVSESSLSHGAQIRLGKSRYVLVDPAVADFEQAIGKDEDTETDWGLMRAQVDMARVKRKRRANLIWSLVIVLLLGGIAAVALLKPDMVQDALGIEDLPVLAKVPGNKVPDESFEGEEPVIWAVPDGRPGEANIAAGPTHQGTRALELLGPASGWEMAIARCGTPINVSPDRSYEIAAWIRPEAGGALARIGVEWSSMSQKSGEKSGEKSGGRYAFTDFAPGSDWTKMSVVVRPPEGAVRCRVVAAVTGPGSARFDDVSFRDVSEKARPQGSIESGSFDFQVSGDGVICVEKAGRHYLAGGGAAAIAAGGELALPPATFNAKKVEAGDGSVRIEGRLVAPGGVTVPATLSLTAIASGLTLELETGGEAEGLAETALAFTVSRDWISGGATFSGESGSRALRGDTDQTGVRKVILGGVGNRLSIAAAEPVRLRMITGDLGLVMALAVPAGAGKRTFTITTDFTEEKRQARSILTAARAARSAQRFGEALNLYTRVVNEFPFEDSVRNSAEKEGGEVLRGGQDALELGRRLYARAKDYHHEADLELALKRFEDVYRMFTGHKISEEAKTEAMALAADLRKRKGDRYLGSAGRLMEQADGFMKHGQNRLAKLFLERVILRYPDTKVSEDAKKRLEEIKGK
jgi:pSer/pThr/pTyr-binding forkhead associated (FHA) protein